MGRTVVGRPNDVFVLVESMGEIAGKHAGGFCETVLDNSIPFKDITT